jgi:hypothetical protein
LPEQSIHPGAPRWVKALGIALAVVVALVAVAHLTGLIAMGHH